jgi:histidinol dehydrogenase
MTKYLKSRAKPDNRNAPQLDVSSVVKGVIDDIRSNGDTAVRKYSEKFDKWTPSSFKLSDEESQAAVEACSKQTIKDIKTVQHNVRTFAQAQKDSLKDFEIEVEPGVFLGQKNNPIKTVGTYVG